MNVAEPVISTGLWELSSLVLLATYTGLQANPTVYVALIFQFWNSLNPSYLNWTFLPTGSSKFSLSLAIDRRLVAYIGISLYSQQKGTE